MCLYDVRMSWKQVIHTVVVSSAMLWGSVDLHRVGTGCDCGDYGNRVAVTTDNYESDQHWWSRCKSEGATGVTHFSLTWSTHDTLFAEPTRCSKFLSRSARMVSKSSMMAWQPRLRSDDWEMSWDGPLQILQFCSATRHGERNPNAGFWRRCRSPVRFSCPMCSWALQWSQHQLICRILQGFFSYYPFQVNHSTKSRIFYSLRCWVNHNPSARQVGWITQLWNHNLNPEVVSWLKLVITHHTPLQPFSNERYSKFAEDKWNTNLWTSLENHWFPMMGNSFPQAHGFHCTSPNPGWIILIPPCLGCVDAATLNGPQQRGDGLSTHLDSRSWTWKTLRFVRETSGDIRSSKILISVILSVPFNYECEWYDFLWLQSRLWISAGNVKLAKQQHAATKPSQRRREGHQDWRTVGAEAQVLNLSIGTSYLASWITLFYNHLRRRKPLTYLEGLEAKLLPSS